MCWEPIGVEFVRRREGGEGRLDSFGVGHLGLELERRVRTGQHLGRGGGCCRRGTYFRRRRYNDLASSLSFWQPIDRAPKRLYAVRQTPDRGVSLVLVF